MRNDITAQEKRGPRRAIVQGLVILGIGLPHAVSAQREITPQPTFDVVSIRQYVVPATIPGGPPAIRRLQCNYFQDRVHCELTVLELIREAFQLKKDQVKSLSPIGDRIFILNATMPPDTSKDMARIMLQHALADRFDLKTHYETQSVSVYAIVPGKKGITLQPADDATSRDKDKIPVGDTTRSAPIEPSGGSSSAETIPLNQQKGARASSLFAPGHVYSTGMSLDLLADNMSLSFDRPVINASGITEEYKFDISWSPDGNGEFSRKPLSDPGFINALEAQGGIRLDRRIIQMKMLVVDHVDADPTEN
jgi:uncharacterized protein (TIGR03435 family)